MPAPRKYDIDPPVLDPDGIAENQTSVGAGNLTLNGALCDLGTAAQFDIEDAYGSAIKGVILEFDSAGDISGITFTITGEDEYGTAQTETVTGVTTTAVSTTKYWSAVRTIASDGAIGSNVFVGTAVGGLVTTAVPLNRYNDDGCVVAVGGLTGTCQYDVDITYDDIQGAGFSASTVWITHTSNASANNAGITLPAGATGVRLKLDSYSDGAELQFYVADQPYR